MLRGSNFVGGEVSFELRRRKLLRIAKGDPPLVIAKGGFSGVFPGSSQDAYAFALLASAPDTSLWCDVQLTKDAIGVCLDDINMKNCTNIDRVYPTRKNKYVVDGASTAGWFSVDFNISELQNVALTQPIYSRTDKFDYYGYPILSVTDLPSIVKHPSVWLNAQHATFYRQHGLNMRSYILSVQKRVSVNYISSPELGFLQSISQRVNYKTKLVYRFPDNIASDPSTNQTYISMLSNLTFIKATASGIMVPKSYIWPVTSDNYLMPPKSIVQDAHKAGLEIYASDFANDRTIPYNYSYDPLQEYLSFISDGDFSVDGVLSDFPITASEAIGSNNPTPGESYWWPHMRNYAHGCFCWAFYPEGKLIMLDTRTMDFSAVNLPPGTREMQVVILEAGKGRLGMFMNEYLTNELRYAVLRNDGDGANQWQSEAMFNLPVNNNYMLMGVAGGYLLLQGGPQSRYSYPSAEKEDLDVFSLNLKTLQLEWFFANKYGNMDAHLFASFPPSLSPPTI